MREVRIPSFFFRPDFPPLPSTRLIYIRGRTGIKYTATSRAFQADGAADLPLWYNDFEPVTSMDR
jgi:hypothetical protein